MMPVYKKNQIKQVDELTANQLNINSFDLMQIAGNAIYSYVRHFNSLLVVTGAGNNAGDGFIMATLALKQGKRVKVCRFVSQESLPVDAQKAAQEYIIYGGEIVDKLPKDKYECIVDALFGTGLSRDVGGHFADAIKWMNIQSSCIVSVDIPSGLDADTGSICGCAVNADMTITVICYKSGLLTKNGKDLCGKLFLENLGMTPQILKKIPTKINLLDKSVLSHKLLFHLHNSHKGSFGQVVIVGGHDGMLGALILAGTAALRSGCGMVEVVSNYKHTVIISIQHPELLTASAIDASRLLQSCDVLAIGPGLGLNQESKNVLRYCLKLKKPMVIDADALTLIAGKQTFSDNSVLTPHPKEAAYLLNTNVATIQSNRIAAAIEIAKKYKACVILKGSGSIIAQSNGQAYICPFGYAGMATAGMGDVLTGIVAALLAQGLKPIDAANCATVWHALAAEHCQKGKSLIASDVINNLDNL